MSMAYCERCDRHVDTDFDVEGECDFQGYQYVCEGCREAIECEDDPDTVDNWSKI